MSVMWGDGVRKRGKEREIDLGDDFGDVVVKANGAQVKIGADGSLEGVPAATNDSAANDATEYKNLMDSLGRQIEAESGRLRDDALDLYHRLTANRASWRQEYDTWRGEETRIGDIESDGKHKGEIYGGIYPADSKPIWFSAAPKAMDHFKAAAWAEGQGGSLPTRKQGDYLTTLKGKGGAFTEIFNRGSSFPAGFVWLAEPSTNFSYGAWCQRLSDGDQNLNFRYDELPVLSVRR